MLGGPNSHQQQATDADNQAERLVRTARNRGARVTQLSIEDMPDVYETRLVRDEYALRVAVEPLDRAGLEAANCALDGMEVGFAKRDQPAAFACDQDFHFTLYQSAGSA